MHKFIKMLIKIKNISLQEGEEKIYEFLSILYKNGQILKNWSVVKDYDNYIAYITATDYDALNDKNYNIYANQCLKYLTIELEIIGDNLAYSEVCKCCEPSWYMLYSDCCYEESPILCGDCGNSVPLYKIPHMFKEKEHFHILSWQNAYQSVHQLWINSLSDRFTKNQIINPNSALSKQGLEICSELEKVFKKPVYFYLRNPMGGLFRFKENNKPLLCCPKCGGNWLQSKNAIIVDVICEKCRIAIDIPEN